MGIEFGYIAGQTPLDPDEIDGLRIDSISTRQELDEFEQQNVEEAIFWVMKHALKTEVILSEAFVCQLHKEMYNTVWSWAGKFRKTQKNIGIDHWQIGSALKCLLDDTLYWIKHETYQADEIALRFKHRLVSIHCFPNGNGRHSRLMADTIVTRIFKQPVFTWGKTNLVQHGDSRAIYLSAVKAADKGNLSPLLDFARS